MEKPVREPSDAMLSTRFGGDDPNRAPVRRARPPPDQDTVTPRLLEAQSMLEKWRVAVQNRLM
jgi:hypothetical protein